MAVMLVAWIGTEGAWADHPLAHPVERLPGCTVSEPSPHAWVVGHKWAPERCTVRAAGPMLYAGSGAWTVEILRNGQHPGGEWLDDSGALVTDPSSMAVARTRIVLTSETAEATCGSAIRAGDEVTVTAPPRWSNVIEVRHWQGTDDDHARLFPGDHRDCLRPG